MVRLALSLALVTLLACAALAQDTLATLRTSEREVHNSIFLTFATGSFAPTGDRAVFKAASPEQRAVLVRAVAALVNTFIASPDFAARYRVYREAQKPPAPDRPQSGDEARAEQQAAIDQAVQQAMATAKTLSGEARRELEENIAEMKRQVAELNADPEYRAALDRSVAAEAVESRQAYEQKLAVWQAEFPEDVNALITRRLRQFLLACGDVDFGAELRQGDDRTLRFVNPAYERRSADWKLCFRAGKPAVDAARAAATAWLENRGQD